VADIISPNMPNLKPINKLVTKARSLRDHHRERHAPSGFAFALADGPFFARTLLNRNTAGTHRKHKNASAFSRRLY
jgi:hypothetical protein